MGVAEWPLSRVLLVIAGAVFLLVTSRSSFGTRLRSMLQRPPRVGRRSHREFLRPWLLTLGLVLAVAATAFPRSWVRYVLGAAAAAALIVWAALTVDTKGGETESGENQK